MDFFGSSSSEPDERKKALRTLTVPQLQALASKFNVDTSPEQQEMILGVPMGEVRKGKDLLVHRLYKSKKVTLEEIAAVKEGAPSRAKGEPAVKQPATGPLVTPTLASQRERTKVDFDTLVAYLDQYRFISRYSDESSYEIELAGALRERFGTIIRQNPVAVPGRRLTIDLDVGGIGIEIKFNASATTLRNAAQQLVDYKTFYADRLVFVCVATPGQEQYKNDIRALGVTYIEK